MTTHQRFSSNRVISKRAVTSENGIVVSQSRVASEIGAHVLAEGGNAVDAAIATSFALHVTEPWMSGLGGCGGMLFHSARDGQTTAVDFPTLASASADPLSYPLSQTKDSDLFGWPGVEEDRNRVGGASIAVPGQVAGMALALEQFGTKRWSDLIAPAIELAEEGLPLDWYAYLMMSSEWNDLEKYPENAEIFLGGPQLPMPQPPQRGIDPTRWRIDPLIKTMLRLRDEGPSAFYEGPLANALVSDVQRFGGFLTRDDLTSYKAHIRPPQEVRYRNARIAFMPELTGGDAIAEVLGIMDARQTKATGQPGPDYFLDIARALKSVWQDRLDHAGDKHRDMQDACTSHLSVVDAEGNIVSMTQTLLSHFGCRRISPETGLFLNNGMYWFDPRPARANSIAPGKRPLGNYSPCLAVDGDRVIGLGAAGGRKIIAAVTQILLFMIDHGMDLTAAMHHPRIDMSGGAHLIADPRLEEDTFDALGVSFDLVHSQPTPFPNAYGIVSSVVRENGTNCGLSEPVNPWSDAVAAEGTYVSPAKT